MHALILAFLLVCPQQDVLTIESDSQTYVGDVVTVSGDAVICYQDVRIEAEIEYIAYGLRGDEDNDENTKTNITVMEASFIEAISKLEELGEVRQDEWGQWIWTKTGKPVGSTKEQS